MRPSTQLAYSRHFQNFLLFFTFASFNIQDFTVSHVLVFCEFLYKNNYSAAAMGNALAAIKSTLLTYGLDVTMFEDTRVAYYIKSIRLKQPFKASLPAIIDFKLLRQIVIECEKFAYPTLFKSVYLTAFYSFLRLSNLVPHSIGTFSALEQLAKGDVFFAPPGLHILVKWSKTLQSRNKVVILKLPSISDTVICPVFHIKQLLKSVPGGQDAPLFQVLCYGRWVPLTDTRVRKHLKDVLMSLNLHNRGIIFHTFRKSGASLAF